MGRLRYGRSLRDGGPRRLPRRCWPSSRTLALCSWTLAVPSPGVPSDQGTASAASCAKRGCVRSPSTLWYSSWHQVSCAARHAWPPRPPEWRQGCMPLPSPPRAEPPASAASFPRARTAPPPAAAPFAPASWNLNDTQSATPACRASSGFAQWNTAIPNASVALFSFRLTGNLSDFAV